jgi:membrane-bound lytic murein transglycosylase B
MRMNRFLLSMLAALVLTQGDTRAENAGAGDAPLSFAGLQPLEGDARAPIGPQLFTEVYKSLLADGVDAAFLEEVARDNELQFDEKFIRSNLLNFLKKDNYRIFLSKKSVRTCRDFMQEHAKALKGCEKRYGIPKEVVTALLWVETKHGRDLGRHHLPSVFMNLALADHPDVLSRALEEAKDRAPAAGRSVDETFTKVRAAAKRKSAWAREQLIALGKMYKAHAINVKSLKGSVSGAFGIPQFIPTSYVSWSADGDGDGKVDLFVPADAICSVANYLKINGWGQSQASWRRAIYHYNRSDDYGQAVLGLARKLGHHRATASDEIPDSITF